MDWRRRKRQILLFLVAILLPAVVLVGLAVRLFRQDAELANKRYGDQQRDALEQVRRDLAGRLEAIKQQEINRRVRAYGAPAGGSTDSAIVLVTPVDGEHLVLPWEADSHAPNLNPRYTSYLRDGETLEFQHPDFTAAAEQYRSARASASSEVEDCEARLSLARVLLKAKRKDEALAAYLAILKQCGGASDEDGIPYRFYAAERLLKGGLDSGAALQLLISEADIKMWRPPLQLYLFRNLFESESGGEIDEARRNVDTQIRAIEQLTALAQDFPRVLARLDPGSGSSTGDSRWLLYGPSASVADDPWLVAITPATAQAAPHALIVSARKIAPAGIRLTTLQTALSEALGEGFPGVRAEGLSDSTAALRSQSTSVTLYIAGVALILGVTLMGGYLLFRDVNREVKMAEMRSHFVASVSHELKTPLTAIRMFAETLLLGRSDDPRTTIEYLQTIMNESERLTQLVDNVLDFSKIERGSKIYRMRPTALADVARSAARAMGYQLEQQGFALNISIDDKLPPVSADPDAMEQAILNLLTNAMKYSGDSRRIELLVQCNNGKEATIAVTDWGLGIAPEEHSRIFEKFYRVRSADRELIAGTGLGLTLVAHIVQAHGGNIDVRSVPGKGSTFSIRIPLQASEAHA